MLWGRFDNERHTLNMYDYPNFEAGSGIADTDDMVNALKEKFETIKGEHHAVIKAKLIAFLLDNAAIEVNPADWFGFIFCGWNWYFTKMDKPFQDEFIQRTELLT